MNGSRSRPRLMLAIGSLGQGGSEKQLTEFVTRLPAGRFEPVLATHLAGAYANHEARIRASGIAIRPLHEGRGQALRRWMYTAREYGLAVRELRPDVVYAWLDETAVFLAPICRALRIPCLVARRNLVGSNMERRYPLLAKALHRAERQALIVTANSDAVAAQCVARGHRPGSIRTIHNGHEVLPALAAPTGAPVTFGYVARFRPEKGHRRLMDVLERMPRGDWRVDLAGDGPMRAEIEQRVASAGLDGHVRFLGAISDVRAFWRDRHAALLLSDTEGMPNALLEAGFAGRPAIGTDTGGIPEVVGDGGIIVPLQEPDQAVAALSALIADGDRRRRLGERAWQHVSARYAMQRMVDAHVAAIDETLALGTRRRWG